MSDLIKYKTPSTWDASRVIRYAQWRVVLNALAAKYDIRPANLADLIDSNEWRELFEYAEMGEFFACAARERVIVNEEIDSKDADTSHKSTRNNY